MNRLLLATLFAATTLMASDIKQCSSTAMVTACIAVEARAQPDTPGFGRTTYKGFVSVTTVDSLTEELGVVISFELADGSVFSTRRTLAGPTEFGKAVTMTFQMGHNKPVRIRQFYVVRLHQEAPDYIVQ